MFNIYTEELLERDNPEHTEKPMEKTYRLITREEFKNKYGNNARISECTYFIDDIPENPVVFKMENIESRYDKCDDIEVEDDEKDWIFKGYDRLYLPKEFIIEIEEVEKKTSTKNKVLIGASVLTAIGVGYLINKFKN